jgi:hypothetical protein
VVGDIEGGRLAGAAARPCRGSRGVGVGLSASAAPRHGCLVVAAARGTDLERKVRGWRCPRRRLLAAAASPSPPAELTSSARPGGGGGGSSLHSASATAPPTTRWRRSLPPLGDLAPPGHDGGGSTTQATTAAAPTVKRNSRLRPRRIRHC